MALAMGLCIVISVAFAMYAEPLVRRKLAAIYDKAEAMIDSLAEHRGRRPGIASAK
jgi:hypothetical protein